MKQIKINVYDLSSIAKAKKYFEKIRAVKKLLSN